MHIDPELAKKCYYDAKARLEALEKKQAILLSKGVHLREIDDKIIKLRDEVDRLAYFAFR